MVGIAENYLFKKVNQAKIGLQPINQVFQNSNWHFQTLDQMGGEASSDDWLEGFSLDCDGRGGLAKCAR